MLKSIPISSFSQEAILQMPYTPGGGLLQVELT